MILNLNIDSTPDFPFRQPPRIASPPPLANRRPGVLGERTIELTLRRKVDKVT